jgi:hypothetical protein
MSNMNENSSDAASGPTDANTVPIPHVATPGANFLSIAPEIRNYVYAFFLERTEPILLGTNCPDPKSSVRASHSIDGIGLLLTSRQIRKEAIGVLCSRNAFLVSAQLDECNDGYHLLQFGI